VTKPHIVIALSQCRGRTIGENALARAKELAKFYCVTVISDSFPDARPEGVKYLKVTAPKFNFLRRFCHVPNEVGFAFSVRKGLRKLEREGALDFVLCHGYTLTRFVGRYHKKEFGARYGMFMHGHIFTRPGGTYDPRVTWFYRSIARACYREADLIFSLSPAQRMLAIGAGANADRVVVSPNGIHPTDIDISGSTVKKCNEVLLRSASLKILYVGRFGVEKGVEILLEACGILSSWNIDYSVTLLGDGAYFRDMVALADRTGISDRVMFIGHMPRQELGAYYRAADILCVPSLDEPLGNVVLEGLISGCLVLGSEVGGIRFILTNGVDGYLVPPGDPVKLAEKFRFISENQEESALLGRRGREMALRRFKWTEIVTDMRQAIEMTLARD